MKNVLSAALLLLLLFAQVCLGDSLRGRWKVRSYTTATQTLDGKETLKGPFTFKPKAIRISIDDQKYIVVDEGKKTEYRLRKTGSDYMLRRESEEGVITIMLTKVKRSGKELRFASTRKNAQRAETTVVEWVCVLER